MQNQNTSLENQQSIAYQTNLQEFKNIDKKRKRLSCISGCKSLIKDLNRQIDLDFIKESEEIEGNFNNYIMELLKKPEIKIIHALPKEALFVDKANSNTEQQSEILKGIFKKTSIYALYEPLQLQIKLNLKNHLYSLEKIFDKAKKSKLKRHKTGKFDPLTHADILETNLYLDEKEDILSEFGRYRSPYTGSFTNVKGATWVPVSNARVSESMDALLEWYNNQSINLHPIIRAAILHAEFIRIHPFADGNGRTARLLMNYELIRNGYPSVIIKARDKDRYFNALNTAIITKDVTDLVKLIEEACNETADKYLEIIKSKKEFEKENE